MMGRQRHRARPCGAARRPRGAQAGFSLLEVLVALSLTAIIAGVAAQGLRLSSAAAAAAAQAAETAAERRALRRFLIDLLEAVAPPLVRDGSRNPPALFQGDATGFATVARLPAALAPASPQLIALRARDGGLELRWGPVGARRPDLALTAPAGLERLVAGPVTARFSYGTDRTPTWSARATAPPLIEIALTWPEETMRPGGSMRPGETMRPGQTMRIVAAPRAVVDAP